MTLGFVMLAHDALDKAARVARHLATQGCPVSIHVDSRADMTELRAMRSALGDLPLVSFVPGRRCHWGTWSLVEASRTAAADLLERHASVRHVYLISGACLPIRPVPEMVRHLRSRRDTDFIESASLRDVPWTQGGLSEERFAFSFPFSWKRRRRLFDAWVDLQRRAGRNRKAPEGIDIHLGSQWWCLSRRTLEAILADPERSRIDGFFKRVWIPDESYYQTMVRRHGRSVESRSLTYCRFGFQGRPHVFYDDHLPLLRQSEHFFARKVWPGAERLYRAFLSPGPGLSVVAEAATGAASEGVFAQAVQRRTRGRAGLSMAGRYPKEGFENGLTATRYAVFHGFGSIFSSFEAWAESTAGVTTHGHLFAPDRVRFAGRGRVGPGALSDNAALRDYNPEAFLQNLLRAGAERQAFLFGADDRQRIVDFVARDPNATVFAITGAWTLPLLRSGLPVVEIREAAARLQKVEARMVAKLRERRAQASLHEWSLADFVARPSQPIQKIVDELGPRSGTPLAQMPVLRSMAGLQRFLRDLRNSGMDPYLAGPVRYELSVEPDRRRARVEQPVPT